MSLAKRVLFIAAVAALLAPGGRAMGAELGRVELTKAEMVRSAIDTTGATAIPAPLMDSLGRPRAPP